MKKITNFSKFVHIAFSILLRPQFFQRTLLQTTHKDFYLFDNIRRKYSFCGMVLLALLGTLQINAQCNPPTKAQQDQYSLSFNGAKTNSIRVRATVPGDSQTGVVLYINTQNTFNTIPGRVITSSSSTAYSGSGQQQVAAQAVSSAFVDYTITGLSANTTYYFKMYTGRLCFSGDEPSGTTPSFDNQFIASSNRFFTLQASTNSNTGPNFTNDQPNALLSADSFNVTDGTAITLKAAINTTQTISYSIQGNANGFSLSGSTLTPSPTDGNSVIIRATAAASGSYPAVSKDFVVKRILPFSIFYAGGKALKRYSEGTTSTVETLTSPRYWRAMRIGNYLYYPQILQNKMIRYNRDGSGKHEITMAANFGRDDTIVEINGRLWGTVGDGRIFSANLDGSGVTYHHTVSGDLAGKVMQRLVDINGKVYGLYVYDDLTGATNAAFIFKIEYNGTGYAKVVDIPTNISGVNFTASPTSYPISRSVSFSGGIDGLWYGSIDDVDQWRNW